VPEIVSEAEIQIAGGAKEILLLGQNVNRYGLDLPPRNSFAECLKTVAQIPGLKRLRFLTGHPSGFTSKVISIMATEPAICQAVHLPLQSGSNRILKAMNRGYTREAFLDLVGEMRAAMPSIAITTDIIAGFPGETERDFEDTLEMAERVAFDAAYCFKYSPRSGTEAARFSGQLPQPIKEERLAKLLQITENITANKNRACIGTHETVLFESRDLKHPGKIFGRTRTNKWVYVEADAKHIGEELPVFINAAGNFSLIGELAHEK
jgi:tRNA-2-methylthio-N6-dimethylallyladenosine synthase